MKGDKIVIGSRGSDLALWQAHFMQRELKDIGYESEVIIIKTQGDRVQDLTFDKLEGKGFFTKEIEDQLLEGTIDVAVHSMKDLPTTPPEGLLIAGVSYREEPTDTLLIKKECVDLAENLRLKKGSIVGTSSARRKGGNVPTRIQKLRDGHMSAIVLASAGLERLQSDVSDLEVIKLHPREFVPAPAQGVLAYQTRREDLNMRRIIAKISKREVAEQTNVERKVLQMMDGGCHLPLGVYCEKDKNGYYHAYGAMGTESGVKRVKQSSSITSGMAELLYAELTS